MGENPIIGIKEKQRRRRRINRIKRTLLIIIIGWIMLSMIALFVLCYKVASLNEKYNKLYDFILSSAEVNGMSVNDPDLSFDDMENEDVKIDYEVKDKDDKENTKKVFLTFDDGPSGNTDAILDVLKENDVKATFFVVGKTDEKSISLYKRIVDEGHTIALHSYSHKYEEIYDSLEKYKEDLNNISQVVYEATGIRTKYMRFPGGSSNSVSKIDMKDAIRFVTEAGYTYFDWNVMSGDAVNEPYTAEDLVNSVMNGVKSKNNSMILFHDATNKDSTVEALKTIIPELKRKGYIMMPIDEDTKKIQHIAVESVMNE